MKIPNFIKASIIIFFALLIALFYESKKVGTLAIGIENPLLKTAALSFSSESEEIKSYFKLSEFFQKDSEFWIKIKKSPEIFTKTIIVTPAPSETSLPSKLEPPYSIIEIGDSFIAERFGPQLEIELLLYNNVIVFRKGVYSTGLSRPDYFNWNEELKEIINVHNPNIAIVMFGANDGQDQITLDENVIHYGDKNWSTEYAKRVDEFLNVLAEKNIYVFWIGNPIPKDEYYMGKIELLNSIYETECQKFKNVSYISSWDFLKDSNGNYSDYLPDENGVLKLARSSDGIHATVFGANILVKKTIEIIQQKIELILKIPDINAI